MAYRLDLGKALGPEIARVGREQIATCRACLADPGGVHEARKGLKRLRALLALAAPAIGRKSASRHSRTCRDIAQSVAARRDTEAMQQTLRRLAAEGGLASGAPLGAVAAALRRAAAAAERRNEKPGAGRGLAQVGAALDALERAGPGKGGLANAAARTYRDCRRAFAAVRRKSTDEALHDLRKAVQRHWRHMQLLRDAWPEAMAARADEARTVSRLLGEHQDLAVLANFIADATPRSIRKADRDAVSAVLAARQKMLLRDTEPHIQRLLAEPARNFERRLATYVRAGAMLQRAGVKSKIRSETVAKQGARVVRLAKSTVTGGRASAF